MPVKTKQQDNQAEQGRKFSAETKLAATILLPLPPDYSGEIEKPIRYVDYIADVIGKKSIEKGESEVTLSIDEVETFVWMLRDAGTVIHKMNEVFYGDNGWNDVWWENRVKLESCGIKLPYWFEIENSRNAEQQGPL